MVPRRGCALVISAITIITMMVVVCNVDSSGATWTTHVVNTQGTSPDIAVNSSGIPHVAYMNWESYDLNYSFYNGSAWESVAVDTIGNVGANPSLAIDSLDRPHISYWDIDGRNLKYAYRNGASWQIRTVDSLGDVGRYSSIAVDSDSKPHVAYVDEGLSALKYARWNGTDWIIMTVDATSVVTNSTTLALDKWDRPHVLYFDDSQQSAKFAVWNGTGWTIEELGFAESTDPGSSRLLALDNVGRPHIACKGYDNETENTVRLDYAVYDGGWKVEQVAEFSMFTSSPLYRSIAVDRFNRPHLTFKQKYAFWDGRLWNTYSLPDIGSSLFNSIAVDGSGNPHITYFDPIGWKIHYLTRELPNLPDMLLLESDIDVTPESPLVNGTTVSISATTYNVGTMNATAVVVRFFDGNGSGAPQINGDEILMEVEAVGGSDTATVVWNATPSGFHAICVHVDPDDVLAELNETNNIACVGVWVVEPEIPSPATNLTALLTGANLQDVTVSWDISVDDGGGQKNVVRYDIYRGEMYDSQGLAYAFAGSVPNGTSTFVDPAAGEGDPSNYFYYVCAVSNANLSSCTMDQAGKFTRPLSPGPNLISIPLLQSNDSIETVLQTIEYDKAWYYDSSSQEWKWYMKHKGYRRGLLSINHTMGMWVNVTQNSNLTVAGIVPAQTTIHLYEGWNLVSFPSFNSSYTVYDLKMDTGAVEAEGYDPAPPYHLRVLGDAEVLLAGEAYWVRVLADTDWIVEVS